MRRAERELSKPIRRSASRALWVLAVLGVACVCAPAGTASKSEAVAAQLRGGQGPVWSPDGKRIAYVGPFYLQAVGSTEVVGLNRLIVVSSADGSGAKTIASVKLGASGLNEVRWPTPGRIVFDVSPDGLLRSVDLASRHVVSLGPIENVAVDGSGEAFSVSPSRRLVAFSTESGGIQGVFGRAVGVVPAGGGPRLLFAKPKSANDAEPAISADGKQIAFVRYQGPSSHGSPGTHPIVYIAATSGGTPKPTGIAGRWPQLSPNGKWIAVLGGSRYDQLQLVPAGGGSPRTLAKRVGSFTWAPDSTRIAFVVQRPGARTASLGIVDLKGRSRSLFASAPLSERTPQWSPDGTHIAFSALDPSDTDQGWIYVVGADGTGLVRLV